MNNPLIDKWNAIIGGIIAALTYIFGTNWFLFAAFLLMNVFDWLTGWYKAYEKRVENSDKGWKGVLKKLCYWVMIALAFIMAEVFIKIGELINVNLQITELLGWFVLASLFVNEIRSIIENLVEAGIYVPAVMKKGLEVTDRILKETEDVDQEDEAG